MKNKSTPHRLRHTYPTVDHRPSTDNYWIDARQYQYPGKKSGEYLIKDRDKALAKAEEIAALVADRADTKPILDSIVVKKLNALGICENEALRQALANATKKNQTTSLAAVLEQFKEHKAPTQVAITKTTTLPFLEKWVNAMGPQTNINDLTLQTLIQTLKGVENPDTYNTRRKHLVNFFSVARIYKIIPENIAIYIPRKARAIDVQILTPEEAAKLLYTTYTAFTDPTMGSSMRAYYAIGMFAGIRPDEIKQLTWADIVLHKHTPPPMDWQRINLDEGDHIFISEAIAGSGNSRNVPIFPTLRAWLFTCPTRTGILVPDINDSLKTKGRASSAFSYRFKKSRRKAGFVLKNWPNDVLRHSFASYTLALTHNRAQLATMMGNSEDIIREHYKRHVSTEVANAFFAILPPDTASAAPPHDS